MNTDHTSSRPPEFPGNMRLDLQLSPESATRLLKVVVVGEGPDPEAPQDEGAPRLRARDAVAALVTAIDAGLFAGAREGQRLEVVRTEARDPTPQDEHGGAVSTWEWVMPPISLHALAVFARMIWTTGARSLSIAQNAHEARLLVRRLADIPPCTARAPGWEVTNHLGEDAKNATILIAFRDDAAPEIVRETQEMLSAWGQICTRGGFTGGGGFPRSAALFSEVGTELRREVFVRFDALGVGPDGWAALSIGLSRIHRRARIDHVDMR